MYIDFAAGTTVMAGQQRGQLVFLQDGEHPGFPSAPLDDRVGFIAFEYYDRAAEDRVFRRLAPDMTYSAARRIVEPFPEGFGRARWDMDVDLDLVAKHISDNVSRSR